MYDFFLKKWQILQRADWTREGVRNISGMTKPQDAHFLTSRKEVVLDADLLWLSREAVGPNALPRGGLLWVQGNAPRIKV